MKTLSGRQPSQRPDELAAFIDLLVKNNVRSYLEIGARHGDTFYEVMRHLPKGAKGVAVDMPGANWGVQKSRQALEHAAATLKGQGYDVRTVYGDSGTDATTRRVASHGPYDAVLIDGDHLYDGVKRDWERYGNARMVAFHDIDGEGIKSKRGLPVEVPKLWCEIKDHYQHTEIIGNDRGMGIGVIVRG